MTELRAGDTVIHYANGKVRAASTVFGAAQRGRRPFPLSEAHLNDGRMARVTMTDITTPISRDDISARLRVATWNGPFNVEGRVNQIYLARVSSEFESTFFDLFGNRFRDSRADVSPLTHRSQPCARPAGRVKA